MPFGPYRTFAQCVRENQDKRDPEAYCAKVRRAIEGPPKRKTRQTSSRRRRRRK